MTIKRFFIITALTILLSASGTHASEAPPSKLPPAGFLDESLFRNGLRERGLTEWLEQYLADTPPLDQIDIQLRRREELLQKASTANLIDAQRESAVSQASQILSELITHHAHHPARLRWQYELARDILERRNPAVFDRFLLYELPGRDRKKVFELSQQAVQVLDRLRQQITDIWQEVESLNELELEAAMATGVLQPIEWLDAQSAYLQTWAKFYNTVSSDSADSEQSNNLSTLIIEINDQYGWTQLPAGQEKQRAGALIMSAITARKIGQYDRANKYARQIITLLGEINDAPTRKQLRKTTLIAVLEQIRILRDRKKYYDALNAINQARKWAQRTRPDAMQAELALAFAEHTTLSRQWKNQTSSDIESKTVSLFQPLEALAPIKTFANQSPVQRDMLYSALAGAVENEPIDVPRSPFVLQILAGSAVMDAIPDRSASPSGDNQRLKKVINAIQNTLPTLESDTSAIRGEMMFLLGRTYYLTGDHLLAAGALSDLAEQFPEHDRAPQAAAQATAIAQELLRKPQWQHSTQARDAFIRAGQLLRKLSPQAPEVKKLQYFIALSLEQNGRLEQAADEYASVSSDDPHLLKALLGRARSLRNALFQAADVRIPNQQNTKQLAQQALAAARQGLDKAKTTLSNNKDHTHLGLVANLELILADLLNHEIINQSEQALKVLEDFETRYADCPNAVGHALRQRVLAHRRLKQLSQARQVVEQYLKTSPESAGPVMAKLLETMRNEIDTAANRGDNQAVKNIATEAFQLAQMLIQWSRQRAEQVPATELLTMQVWHAWSLLMAGRPVEAIEIYKLCQQTGKNILPANSALLMEISLGQAECLLALDQADEALPIFTKIWQSTPERSAHWWRALVGSLESHTRLNKDPKQILNTIKQQRYLSPDLGGPRWTRALKTIEKTNQARIHKKPSE